MPALVAIFLSYFFGAIPFGYLIAKKKGIDIRRYGSGNTGATNVYRVVGKKEGIITLALDILKGFIPVLAVKLLLPREAGTAALCGVSAIMGHNWSPFLNFKGGKGVATSAGVFLAILPLPSLAALLAFAVAAYLTKHVSVGSITGVLTLFLVSLKTAKVPMYKYVAFLTAVLIVVKHWPNIQRLRQGKEPKFNWTTKP